MKLILVRHGEAQTNNPRGLTQIGITNVQKSALFTKQAGIHIDEIWHSEKLRAKQTAEIFGIEFGKSIIEKKGLKPNDAIEPMAELINSYAKNILVVGHLPFLADLANYLTKGCLIKCQPGSVGCFEKSELGWILDWFMNPSIL